MKPGLIDEYLIRITGGTGAETVLKHRSENISNDPIQYLIETARSLRYLPADRVQSDQVIHLLNHQNPHIGVTVLESLNQMADLDTLWVTVLETEMVHFPDNPEFAVTYLELLQQYDVIQDEHLQLLDLIDKQHPYLKNRTLSIYRKLLDSNEYLDLLRKNIDEEGIKTMHATSALVQFVGNREGSTELREFVRSVMIKALNEQNRSALSVAEPILANPIFFTRSDEQLLKEALERALLQNDRAVSQVMVSVLESHDLIDEGQSIKLPMKPMRLPDWNRLKEMASDPKWILETNKGEIVIQLDPLAAPFTVSSIDHLTQSGQYDGVVFHRVVRNFVVQGGDFDRKDGFGGPQYRIPTEPSFDTFKRGAVGMASSGPDTEGSQFFITHTHTPHLDGLYTIFGEVIDGMDVVDRIQIGDV
ncbi:MAG: peptidylprolyl isomerase, partial [Balneolaceae bacterium]